jgi:plasmid stabilization system protein ParE
MQIKLSNNAIKDVDEAYLYYKKISGAELADRFFSDFETRYHKLVDNFGIGSLRYKFLFPNVITRFTKLKSFPYLVFYKTDMINGVTEVMRVFHERRDFVKYATQ